MRLAANSCAAINRPLANNMLAFSIRVGGSDNLYHALMNCWTGGDSLAGTAPLYANEPNTALEIDLASTAIPLQASLIYSRTHWPTCAFGTECYANKFWFS